MLVYVLMLTLFSFSASADEAPLTEDEKSECVKQLIEWCKDMQYPKGGIAGLAMMSISYQSPETFYRVFCVSDSNGTNCTRNALQWFNCSSDHVLTYKGEELSESTSDVDNDICETANKVTTDLFMTNLSSDNETLTLMHKELEPFFRTLQDMQRHMSDLRKMMSMIPGMMDGVFGGFDDFDSERSPEIVTLPPNNEQQNKNDNNDIEKE